MVEASLAGTAVLDNVCDLALHIFAECVLLCRVAVRAEACGQLPRQTQRFLCAVPFVGLLVAELPPAADRHGTPAHLLQLRWQRTRVLLRCVSLQQRRAIAQALARVMPTLPG